MRIGVVSIQGDVEEHVRALERTLRERDEKGEIIRIKHRGFVEKCDALVIPGGESTTLGRLMDRERIIPEIRGMASRIPIMGTCAGLILLAKRGDEEVERTGQKLLGLMDVKVCRNAFGRQRESFEVPLKLSILKEPFNAVFIRAPAIVEWGEDIEVLGKLEEYVVAAKQENLLALAFHPELTDDTRIHHYFLDMI
ncbi:MAG: pyridoxal 5'-phosphate synthase glutaminase subunit PdxT [Candidatus Syntropharchaeia archaeon]